MPEMASSGSGAGSAPVTPPVFAFSNVSPPTGAVSAASPAFSFAPPTFRTPLAEGASPEQPAPPAAPFVFRANADTERQAPPAAPFAFGANAVSAPAAPFAFGANAVSAPAAPFAAYRPPRPAVRPEHTRAVPALLEGEGAGQFDPVPIRSPAATLDLPPAQIRILRAARDAADAYFCLPAAVKASHHDHDGDGPSLVGGVGYHVDFAARKEWLNVTPDFLEAARDLPHGFRTAIMSAWSLFTGISIRCVAGVVELDGDVSELIAWSERSTILTLFRRRPGGNGGCPWHVDRGLMTVVFAEEEGLRVEAEGIGELRADGSEYGVTLMVGATLAHGRQSFPNSSNPLVAARHRVDTLASDSARVALAFKLRAAPDTRIPGSGITVDAFMAEFDATHGSVNAVGTPPTPLADSNASALHRCSRLLDAGEAKRRQNDTTGAARDFVDALESWSSEEVVSDEPSTVMQQGSDATELRVRALSGLATAHALDNHANRARLVTEIAISLSDADHPLDREPFLSLRATHCYTLKRLGGKLVNGREARVIAMELASELIPMVQSLGGLPNLLAELRDLSQVESEEDEDGDEEEEEEEYGEYDDEDEEDDEESDEEEDDEEDLETEDSEDEDEWAFHDERVATPEAPDHLAPLRAILPAAAGESTGTRQFRAPPVVPFARWLSKKDSLRLRSAFTVLSCAYSMWLSNDEDWARELRVLPSHVAGELLFELASRGALGGYEIFARAFVSAIDVSSLQALHLQAPPYGSYQTCPLAAIVTAPGFAMAASSLTVLDLHGLQIAGGQLWAITGLGSVEELRLRELLDRDHASLAAIRMLPRLRSLSLIDCKPICRDLSFLPHGGLASNGGVHGEMGAGRPKLKHLALSVREPRGGSVTVDCASILRAGTTIEELDVSFLRPDPTTRWDVAVPPIRDLDLAKLILNLPNLRRCLARGMFENEGCALPLVLSHATKLEMLDASRPYTVGTTGRSPQGAAHNTAQTDATARQRAYAWSGLGACETLRDLNIDGHRLPREAGEILGKLCALEKLDASESTLESIAFASKLPGLSELVLHGCPALGAHDEACMRALASHPLLRTLDLRGTYFCPRDWRGRADAMPENVWPHVSTVDFAPVLRETRLRDQTGATCTIQAPIHQASRARVLTRTPRSDSLLLFARGSLSSK